MRAAINQTLDILEANLEINLESASLREAANLKQLSESISQVQDAYLDLIQQALRLLMQNRLNDCHKLLQQQREDLTSTYARIGRLIDELTEVESPLLKLIVEYLFTRARLVEELKVFPAFGIELLERLSFDESIEATVNYLEHAMTGKQDLYGQVVDALQDD